MYNYKKLAKRNKAFEERAKEKIEGILEDPCIGTPKRHNLRGVRGVHIDPFVITYTVIGDAIVFISINHHDVIYDETSTIYAQLEKRYSDLWSKPID
ncbi:MAG: type II toxin-antitoxin system mRNA interferase toxin, RelE/StbE family [Methanotrichaceae archaeon]|nr:type II toxin-antitoxin system mRNA interferase toxin, RelE/StbE family [Methanotrichaceae archaeon]